MSIETAITNAQGRVADCYTAILNKGGAIPAAENQRNLSNMPTAINSIPNGSGALIMTYDFYFTHDSLFNLASVTDTVCYAIGNGNIPIALLYDSNGDLITRAPYDQQQLVIDFENSDIDETEAEITIFDADNYPTKYSILHIYL